VPSEKQQRQNSFVNLIAVEFHVHHPGTNAEFSCFESNQSGGTVSTQRIVGRDGLGLRVSTSHRVLQLCARRCERLRVCEFRTTRPVRGLRGVLHYQFDNSPSPLSSPESRHCDAEVDTRRNAATGEPIAIDADAFAAGLGAKLAQDVPGPPVHCGAIASQQSSGT
jgi:hypothetical protein